MANDELEDSGRETTPSELGAAPYGNFRCYYSFNPAQARVSLIPANLLDQLFPKTTTSLAILDVGCNSGGFAVAFYQHVCTHSPPVHLLGLDLDPWLISQARSTNRHPQNIRYEQEEEEWKEFEQKETDYSGLRIQALQVGEDLPEEDGESKEEKESEVGGDGFQREGERGEGPWNKSSANTPAASVEVSESRSTPGVVGGVYRPPGYRSTPHHPRRGPQAPPEISSEAQFPSLQAATKTESRRERDLERTFETVKHRMRAREDDKSKPLELELGNQFAVLGD
uniref:Carnitine deficiency-associated gene expressed in ventricle 3 n=1 Tax=Eptatretus burgeri TaxID=7764 RepID=A0A8C4Q2B0_EPTBU